MDSLLLKVVLFRSDVLASLASWWVANISLFFCADQLPGAWLGLGFVLNFEDLRTDYLCAKHLSLA